MPVNQLFQHGLIRVEGSSTNIRDFPSDQGTTHALLSHPPDTEDDEYVDMALHIEATRQAPWRSFESELTPASTWDELSSQVVGEGVS